MRTLLLSSVATVALVASASSAYANDCGGKIAREIAVVDQLNHSRPPGLARAAIDNQVRMIRYRVQDLSSGRLSPAEALTRIDESLAAIQQYNHDRSDEAPFVARDTEMLTSRMRQDVQQALVAYSGGYGGGYRGGYEGGYGGQRGGYKGGYGRGRGYEPRWAPPVRRVPAGYVPPPAPARSW